MSGPCNGRHHNLCQPAQAQNISQEAHMLRQMHQPSRIVGIGNWPNKIGNWPDPMHSNTW